MRFVHPVLLLRCYWNISSRAWFWGWLVKAREEARLSFPVDIRNTAGLAPAYTPAGPGVVRLARSEQAWVFRKESEIFHLLSYSLMEA